MSRTREEDAANNEKWEAEQLAREQRSKRYALEKKSDNVEMQIDDSADDENAGRYQFMANFNANRGILGPYFDDSDDEAVYLDSL